MPNLLSTGTPSAGRFLDAILSSAGSPVTNTPVTVYQSDGSTVATLYTDQTKATTLANPVNTDAYGNLGFYTDPGLYVLSFTVGGVATNKTVQINPWYADAAWNVVNDTTVSGGSTFTSISGDSRMCNAAAGNGTYTLPAATQGTRLKITRTDSSSNTVTINPPSGAVFLGLGLGSGLTALTLSQQGAFYALIADGTDYHVVGPVNDAWTSYTPTIGGTGWAAGNAVVTGRYRQIDAKTVALAIEMQFGSSTTVGSGQLTLSLPSGMTSASNVERRLSGIVADGTNSWAAIGYLAAGANYITPTAPLSTSDPALNGLTSAHTFAAGPSSVVEITGVIEIA